MLHSADEYGATAVTGENLELQADDAKTIFVLAHFPVVRPRAVYDLQGNQVGSTSNPITVTYNAVALGIRWHRHAGCRHLLRAGLQPGRDLPG